MLKRTFIAAAMLGLLAGPALAQTGPYQNPTYLPAAVIPPATIAAGVASTIPYQVNSQSTVCIRIAGSPSGLAAKIEGTEARTTQGVTPNWSTLTFNSIGGGVRGTSISGNGLYCVNAAGLAQIRLNVSALTSGATTASFAGGVGGETPSLTPTRASYSAASLIATGATSHFAVITGSATTTVRVTHAECSGTASAAIALQITAEVDSAADTGDAGTALTAVPNDSTDPAASASVKKHTTSPTPGALVGLVAAGSLMLGTGATIPPTKLEWNFGNGRAQQEIVLRGVAQSFSLNTSAAFGTGASVGCTFNWSEE